MGQKQTILNEKEEKVYNAVKDVLVEQGVVPTNSDYAMIKYCIARVCKQTIDILRKSSIDISTIGLRDEDFVGIFKLRTRKKNE